MNPIRLIRAVIGWTQSRLAGAARTSQPTIAAYETGTKSPTWRTIQGVARSAGLACYPFVGVPMTRDQLRSLALHEAIAVKLHVDPGAHVERARGNVQRMLTANPHAASLLAEWSSILDMPIPHVVSRMLDPSDRGRDLRQVTPFAGVLNARERASVTRAFRAAA